MDLTPYLENLRRDLAAAAAPGGPEITRAAELLVGSLDASARLGMLEALSDAAAEITAKLEGTTVEVRLHGRDADLVVTDFGGIPAPPPPPGPPGAPPPPGEPVDVSRITLRLPEPLKEAAERAAAAEGISVNAWLVRVVAQAVQVGPPHRASRSVGRRMTGFAQA